MEKLTKREKYELIISMIQTGEIEVDPQVIVDFCNDEIALLDKKAEKAKERAATKTASGDDLSTIVESVLTDEFKTIAEIFAAVEAKEPTATTQKVTYRLGQLVDSGAVTKKQITVKGGEGSKPRKLQAYAKVSE